MNQCISCKATELERTAFEYVLRLEGRGDDGAVRERRFLGEVEGYQCTACGEVFYDNAALEGFDARVAGWLVEHGYESGDELRFVRKAAGLRAADVARLLGVSAQTVSSWENGKHAADASTRGILGALALETLAGVTTTRDRLEAMREPRREADVHLPPSHSSAAE